MLLQNQDPGQQRLLHGSTVLDDPKTLTEAGIENDAMLALVFQQDGACGQRAHVSTTIATPNPPDGSWEEVDIEAPPLDEGP